MSLCDGCGGACCRGVVLPHGLIGGLSPDEAYWLGLHGTHEGHGLYLAVPCRLLGEDGRCTDYEHRPEVCRRFAVGGEACQRSRRRARLIEGR